MKGKKKRKKDEIPVHEGKHTDFKADSISLLFLASSIILFTFLMNIFFNSTKPCSICGKENEKKKKPEDSGLSGAFAGFHCHTLNKTIQQIK